MPSEVKGVWFVTARSYIERQFGSDTLDRIVDSIPREYRGAIEEPLASTWYPEEALQQALSAMHVELANADDKRFVEIVEESTREGVTRFFRVLLRVSTPGFVLRRVPTMWKQIRRGAGKVEVTVTDGDIVIEYTEFPYFEDKLYRLLTLGSLRGLVELATHRGADIQILDHGPSHCTVVVSADVQLR